MYNTTDQLLKRIDEAKDQIRKLFREQCLHGQQTTSLRDPEAAACGQFLRVQNRPQRGLHGTAAAIHALAEDIKEQGTAALISRMLSYIRDRKDYDKEQKCERDDNNVVKISEIIIALKRVPTATGFVAQLDKKIRSSFMRGRGWSWFLDDQGDPEPFPTAYACYALSTVGSGAEVDAARKYLMECLKQDNKKNDSAKKHADIITDVFCLYVLTVVTAGQTTSEDLRFLRDTFDRIWHRLEALLGEDLEQNIEYWDRDETCYVRIPWQLYLLALASHYRFHRRFSSLAAQTKLLHILDMVKHDNYLYPYSGKFLSSRTYAILYEVLEMIHRNVEHRHLLHLVLLWDYAMRLLRTKKVRFLVLVLVTVALAYVGYRWYLIRGQEDYSGIFGNIIAAWLLYVLSWAQRSR